MGECERAGRPLSRVLEFVVFAVWGNSLNVAVCGEGVDRM